jgi:hypothetical protein
LVRATEANECLPENRNAGGETLLRHSDCGAYL